MTTLLTRLEGAEKGSRELDALIECEFGDGFSYGFKLGKKPGTVTSFYKSPYSDQVSHSTYKAPRFTTSVDAAIALAERVLPGMQVNVSLFTGKLAEASLGARHKYEPCLAATPAIALCICILKASGAGR